MSQGELIVDSLSLFLFFNFQFFVAFWSGLGNKAACLALGKDHGLG